MRFVPLLLLLSAVPLAAEVRIIAPLAGSQVAGATLLEATVDTTVARVEFLVDGRLVGVARKSPYRLVHDFGTDLAAHSITAIARSTDFQTSQHAEIRTLALTSSDALTVNLVELPLVISSRRPVHATDIEVLENGRRQQIDELRRQRGATHFVFVVDRSLSMQGGKLDASLAAVDTFRAALDRDDTASLITFNHQVSRSIDVPRDTKSGALVRPAIPSGGTSLRDALLQVDRRKRTIVIVISDGADRNSIATSEEVVRKVGNRDITLYALLLGKGNAAPLLRELATRSGGENSITSLGGLRGELLKILEELNSRYVAIYQSTSAGSGWRSIDARSRSRSVRVSAARKGYFSE